MNKGSATGFNGSSHETMLTLMRPEPLMTPLIPKKVAILPVYNVNGAATPARETTVWSVFTPAIQSVIFSAFWTATCICPKVGRMIPSVVNRQAFSFCKLSAKALPASEVQNLLVYSRKFQKQRWKKFYIKEGEKGPAKTCLIYISRFWRQCEEPLVICAERLEGAGLKIDDDSKVLGVKL